MSRDSTASMCRNRLKICFGDSETKQRRYLLGKYVVKNRFNCLLLMSSVLGVHLQSTLVHAKQKLLFWRSSDFRLFCHVV